MTFQSKIELQSLLEQNKDYKFNIKYLCFKVKQIYNTWLIYSVPKFNLYESYKLKSNIYPAMIDYKEVTNQISLKVNGLHKLNKKLHITHGDLGHCYKMTSNDIDDTSGYTW